MENNKTVDITFVLDRSGSMQSVVADTIGGFNRFLEDQKKAEGKATVALNQFDDIFDQVYPPTDIQSAALLNKETFVPRGSTALLDAIGRTINETGGRLSMLPEDQRPAKVMIVIITDGHENASQTFNAKKINEMISHQRDVYQWEFVYLGANQDAITTAAGIGISAGTSMTYAANTVGTHRAFDSLCSNTKRMRAAVASGKSTKGTMSWTTEQREEQKDAGAKK